MTPRMLQCVGLAGVLCFSACAESTRYAPRVAAPGELTLGYHGRFELQADGRPVAHGLLYRGLSPFVGCVPAARVEARRAESAGTAAMTLSVLGIVSGVAGASALPLAVADDAHAGRWLGVGLSVAVAGTVFAGVSRYLKNKANGAAVDAMNHYNDALFAGQAPCAVPVQMPGPAPAR